MTRMEKYKAYREEIEKENEMFAEYCSEIFKEYIMSILEVMK